MKRKKEALKHCNEIQRSLDKLNSLGFSLDLGDGILSIFDDTIKVDCASTFGVNEHKKQVIFNFNQYVKIK